MSKQEIEEKMITEIIEAKMATVEIAIVCLGRLALAGPGARLKANEVIEMRQALFDALEVLNDEKENY